MSNQVLYCDKCDKELNPQLFYDFKSLGKYCLDCMTCSVCGSKSQGEKRFIWFDIPYCTECYNNKLKRMNGFENRFGKLILHTTQGRYYGGHKAFLSGGLFSKEESGQMWLTERYFIYSNAAIRHKNRYLLKIPLKDVIISDWSIREDTRRKQMSGLGVDIGYGVGVFGGLLAESGKKTSDHITLC